VVTPPSPTHHSYAFHRQAQPDCLPHNQAVDLDQPQMHQRTPSTPGRDIGNNGEEEALLRPWAE